MACHKLPNYLSTYRKRSGLSQRDVAFLLGDRTSSRVSRYERMAHTPDLKTALALEAILKAPVQELFTGLHEEAHHRVAGRWHGLCDQWHAQSLKPSCTKTKKI